MVNSQTRTMGKLILKNTTKHLDNMQRISNGEDVGLEDYSYLDSCNLCGKKFKFLEANTHSFSGNFHKFGCSLFGRMIGVLYSILILTIKIPILIIIAPFYYTYELIKLVSQPKPNKKDSK